MPPAEPRVVRLLVIAVRSLATPSPTAPWSLTLTTSLSFGTAALAVVVTAAMFALAVARPLAFAVMFAVLLAMFAALFVILVSWSTNAALTGTSQSGAPCGIGVYVTARSLLVRIRLLRSLLR